MIYKNILRRASEQTGGSKPKKNNLSALFNNSDTHTLLKMILNSKKTHIMSTLYGIRIDGNEKPWAFFRQNVRISRFGTFLKTGR